MAQNQNPVPIRKQVPERLSIDVVARAKTSAVRAGVLRTSRGDIHTPAFMPVGTHGAVNAMLPSQLEEHGAEIVVCNAFHLARAPGRSVLRGYESLHKFMGWRRAILTDSGGFQVYRLEHRVVHDDGVAFSDASGAKIMWRPEDAIDIQAVIGSDFVMPLDECIALPSPKDKARAALERTLHWAQRSLDAAKHLRPTQTMFGIVQGATYPDLREQSIRALDHMGFGAFAIGGLNVGETEEEFRKTLAFTIRCLPDERPRYLMGVGRPTAMVDAVAAGVDLMDSIIPVRYAREGSLLTNRGILYIQKPRYAKDRIAVDTSCDCYTCRNVSRGYLHHLFATTRTTAQMFATIHNVSFCLQLMRDARAAVIAGRFEDFYREFMQAYRREQDAMPESRRRVGAANVLD
jgi:queuine tRNA-ribosyltransferase